MFVAFLVFVAFVSFIVFNFFVMGTHLPMLSVNGCELPTVSRKISPRLSPLRQTPVHLGTHSHSEDPESLLAGGT